MSLLNMTLSHEWWVRRAIIDVPNECNHKAFIVDPPWNEEVQQDFKIILD